MRAELGHDVSLATLAQLVGMSKHHFVRCFRESVGMAPHQFLLELRMAEARWRLSRTQQELSTIALSLGFAAQSHFTSAFSRSFGTPPGAYRALMNARAR